MSQQRKRKTKRMLDSYTKTQSRTFSGVLYVHSQFLCSLARFDIANRGVRQPVQPHTIYAGLLVFDETSAQPDFAVFLAWRWAVLPVGWFSRTIGLFLSLRCGIFLLLRFSFFGASLIKTHAVFGLSLQKIFLSKSIVFVNSAQVVRFVFTWSSVIDGFFCSFLFSWCKIQ